MENTKVETVSSELIDLYKNGNYESFIESTLERKDQLKESVFHYNVGTAYAKMGQLAIGRYHLEKAKKSGSLDTRIGKNIEYIKSKLAISDIDDSTSYYEKSVDHLVSFDLNTYIFISLILFTPLLLMWRNIFEKSIKSLIISLIISLIPFTGYFMFKDYAHAIILKTTQMREGPSEAFDEMGSIEPGLKIIIGKSDTGWVLIKHPEYLSGWVKADDLGIY